VLDYVQEKVTLFVMALIAPFISPIMKAVSASLKLGNNTVVDSSKKTQFEVGPTRPALTPRTRC
jgi:hypothetical protein